MYDMEYLIIGNPRNGSKFSAELFSSLGFPTVHEQPEGIENTYTQYVAYSSWAFNIIHSKDDNISPKYGLYPEGSYTNNIRFKRTVTHLRNPFDAFPSLLDENNNHWSRNIRFRYIYKKLGKNISEISQNKLEQTILSYLYWNEIALSKSDFFFRIEHDVQKVKDYLEKNHGKINETTQEQETKKVNSKPRNKYKIEMKDYDSVSSNTKDLLNEFCQKYQYDWMLT